MKPRRKVATIVRLVDHDYLRTDMPAMELVQRLAQRPASILELSVEDGGGRWSQAWLRLDTILLIRDA